MIRPDCGKRSPRCQAPRASADLDDSKRAVVYGTLLNFAAEGRPRLGIPIGAIHAFLLSSTIGWLEIFGSRTRPGRVIEQAPFLVTLLVRGLIYGSMIAFVKIVEPGTRLFRVGVESVRLVSVVFSVAATWALIFMLQSSHIIGGRTLRDRVLGRYHRPRGEE